MFLLDEERLDAHQKVDMPLVFFVDPALADDPEMRDLDTITLSYTFFRLSNPDKAKDLSRFLANAEPCHALDINKTGPMLGGLIGRKAGSAPGYRYSPALSSADLIWSPDNLDRWLADPRKFIPDARMPVRVLEASARRDIIAYLEKDCRELRDRSEPRSIAQGSADQHRKE
jgi:cytochrome c oxidase assembly protein subunit 11